MHTFYDIENIKLTNDYLTDPILMALAWKRAHNYVRSHNWYADNFELDQSTLLLQENYTNWTSYLNSEKLELTPLELVPAPKTSKWIFKENENIAAETNAFKCLVWQPEFDTEISLRPLAHIGIKEQTYFTLLISCLANTVESLQGDPTTEFDKVHEKGVVSYGNRLFCTYNNEGEAEHNYGSTTIYSKYFTDYRTFLQRPYYFAQRANIEKLSGEDVYIIELDLKRFFDNISRAVLVDKILKITKEKQGYKCAEPIKILVALLESFKKWEWSKQAKKDYIICSKKYEQDILEDKEKHELRDDGIPQGLVAGGFLSNIYLLDFDAQMNGLLNQRLDINFTKKLKDENPCFEGMQLPEAKLVDYCRYVDDIRLVVTVENNLGLNYGLKTETIKRLFECYLKEYLIKSCDGLDFNGDKTKVTIYRGKPKGISTQVEDINQRASGPMGVDDINELIGQLETLLVLSGIERREQTNENGCINKLAEIESNTFDLREDTLRRFAANKLSRALKEKRHFTAREVDKYGNPIAGEWDYLQERIARRLIAVWSQDPSLVLLLKKGLELFPSPYVLKAVLEQFKIISTSKDKQQMAIMDYCLAEIFRHSATVIHKKNLQAIPAHADIAAYFEVLQQEAADRVVKRNEKEWCFLTQQARFLLLVRMDTTLEIATGDAKQDLIFKLAKGFRNIKLNEALQTKDISLCILLANQLLDDNGPLLRSALEIIAKQSVTERKNILTLIAKQNSELAGKLINRKIKIKLFESRLADETRELAEKLYLDIVPSKTPLSKLTMPQGLVQLFIRPDNPYANEIMAIKLMISLINELRQEKETYGKVVDLAKSTVTFPVGYSEVPQYKHFDCELELNIKWQDAIFEDPLESRSEKALSVEDNVLRKIAFVIRAALASSKDTTGFGVSNTPKEGYRGIKSTQEKRKIGLYTTPESLAGEGAQVSSWLTTLLTKLLRWPGVRANNQGYTWPNELGFNSVKKLLEERMRSLKVNYCQLSNMPSLIELVSPTWSENKQDLNVVMVQSKLPKQEDFGTDLFLENQEYRVQHRRHIANLAQLAVKYIQVENIKVDLIVWPELAVHPDDLDILKQLSQKTHAIIFSGLSFQKLANNKIVNCAVWIVPRKHNGNNNEIMRLQGKQHMTELERGKIHPYRPYQLMLELRHPKFSNKKGFMLTGSICYDATDIKLAADLTNKSNAFIVSALNKDTATFNNMVEALHYHMHQPVVLVNTGEFGSSYAMAPYKNHHDKLIAHTTGKNQIAISSFKINMFDFRRDGVGKSLESGLGVKTRPAGV